MRVISVYKMLNLPNTRQPLLLGCRLLPSPPLLLGSRLLPSPCRLLALPPFVPGSSTPRRSVHRRPSARLQRLCACVQCSLLCFVCCTTTAVCLYAACSVLCCYVLYACMPCLVPMSDDFYFYILSNAVTNELLN